MNTRKIILSVLGVLLIIGGYFGARLVQAGNNVTFIARGKHLEAIQKNGLQLKSPKGDCLIHPANATDSITKIKNIDLVLVCVKTWQLKEVAKIINKNIDEKTVVISLLNGVENQDILCSEISKKHVIGGLCKVISKVEDYGVIHHMSYEPTIVFGELNNIKTKRYMINKYITRTITSNRNKAFFLHIIDNYL